MRPNQQRKCPGVDQSCLGSKNLCPWASGTSLVVISETPSSLLDVWCPILQGEEKIPPPPASSTQLGLQENFPFRSNCSIHGEAGKTEIRVPKLGEVAANSPGPLYLGPLWDSQGTDQAEGALRVALPLPSRPKLAPSS